MYAYLLIQSFTIYFSPKDKVRHKCNSFPQPPFILSHPTCSYLSPRPISLGYRGRIDFISSSVILKMQALRNCSNYFISLCHRAGAAPWFLEISYLSVIVFSEELCMYRVNKKWRGGVPKGIKWNIFLPQQKETLLTVSCIFCLFTN